MVNKKVKKVKEKKVKKVEEDKVKVEEGKVQEIKVKEDKKALCIRSVSNFSKITPEFLVDQKAYDADNLKQNIPNAAPKIEKLFNKIKELDDEDLRIHNKLFKHMIFTDMHQSSYGAKILASSFVSNNFVPAYYPPGSSFSKKNEFTLKDADKLEETEYSNFGVLISKPFYNIPMTNKFKKDELECFNNRPNNINGKYMRFIILDQGFKEGIDLFDIKYVHLMEPLTVKADEKQAIGRSTRFCGQKGLEFQPNYGWPLYVYKYDVCIDNCDSDNKFTFDDLYKKYSKIDFSKMIFASELDAATQSAAIDSQLTKSIHEFNIPEMKGGSNDEVNKELILKKPPIRKMNIKTMQGFIRKNYKDFKYPPIKIENKCVEESTQDKGDAAKDNKLVTFSPTQEFIRNFFQPSSAYKGLLLYNGVGTGKTLTGIATATSSFEQEGYTILWVTRHTLKSDIWKNMFKQIGNMSIREKVRKGFKLPENITNPMDFLSKNWMRPISYKQFSNMLLGKNEIYKEIIKRNGTKDPLRKTLLIIDEAHKLYSPTVPIQERPNMKIFEEMIQNSYIKSRKNSVRVMLMTATPYTESPMEMIKLFNLFKLERFQFPTKFDTFKDEYLDDQGHFTNKGLTKYKNRISGYVSYLDRSNDVRFFAHPIIENILVPMTKTKTQAENKDVSLIDKLEVLNLNIKNIEAENKSYNDIRQNINKDIKKCERDANITIKLDKQKIRDDKKKYMDACNAECKGQTKKCKEIRKECKKNYMDIDDTYLKDIEENLIYICNENKFDEIDKLKERYAESLKNLVILDSEKGKINKEINEYKSEIKELKSEQTWLKKELVNQNNNVKNAKNKLTSNQKQKPKHELDVDKKYYELQLSAYKSIKADIIKNNIEITLLKIKLGLIVDNQMSQQKMLKERCNVDLDKLNKIEMKLD
jgi:hypothetical protein